jgi:hypothetical protein
MVARNEELQGLWCVCVCLQWRLSLMIALNVFINTIIILKFKERDIPS